MAAISTEAQRPYDILTLTITSATDWEQWTVPTWCREITIQNPGASDMYVSKDETGTYGAADQQYKIAAGAEMTIHLSAGRAGAREAAQRTISVASGAGTYLVNVYLRG